MTRVVDGGREKMVLARRYKYAATSSFVGISTADKSSTYLPYLPSLVNSQLVIPGHYGI
jgi:hypothetical protein